MRSNVPKIIYVMGVTCAGKDYFVERALDQFPNTFGAVQVGKEMRKRYPPEHFLGTGAPQHTEKEAVQIYEEELQKRIEENKKVIFVVGQPRRLSQIETTIRQNPGEVLLFHVSPETQVKRMMTRFSNDAKSMLLSCQRIDNDRIQLYDVIFQLMKEFPILTFDGDVNCVDELIQKLAQRSFH